MDVTPLVSKGRQLIESYGDGAFKIGVVYNAPVVFPESCFSPDYLRRIKVISDYCRKFSKQVIASVLLLELKKH